MTRGQTKKTKTKPKRKRGSIEQQQQQQQQVVDGEQSPNAADSAPETPKVKRPKRDAKTDAKAKLDMMAANDDIEPVAATTTTGALVMSGRHLRGRDASFFNVFMSDNIGDVVVGGGASSNSMFDHDMTGGRATSYVQKPTETRDGMNVALGIISVKYKDQSKDYAGGSNPSGPEVFGIVIDKSISFIGMGEYGTLTGDEDGSEGDFIKFVKTRMSPQEKQEMKEADRAAKRKRKTMPEYRTESSGIIRHITAGVTAMKIEVFRASDAVGPNRSRFRPGQVIMCHGVRWEQRISDPVNKPNGYTGFTAASMTAADQSLYVFDLGSLSTMDPSMTLLHRPAVNQVKWLDVGRQVAQDMDMDYRAKTRLMKTAVEPATRRMLDGDTIINTTGTTLEEQAWRGANPAELGVVVHAYRPVEFSHPSDSSAWTFVKDAKTADGTRPRITMHSLKTQICTAAQQECVVEDDGTRITQDSYKTNVLIAHLTVVVPEKFSGSYGIANAVVACAVFPYLVPVIPAAFGCFCDYRETIPAFQNLQQRDGQHCRKCARFQNGVDKLDCCSITYVAKNVFPDLIGGLIDGSKDKDNVNTHSVSFAYAAKFMACLRKGSRAPVRPAYDAAAASSFAESNSLDQGSTDKTIGLFNVAESAHTPSIKIENMVRWNGYSFFVVYGFDIRQNTLAMQAMQTRGLGDMSPVNTGAFLCDTLNFHANPLQVVYAVSPKRIASCLETRKKHKASLALRFPVDA